MSLHEYLPKDDSSRNFLYVTVMFFLFLSAWFGSSAIESAAAMRYGYEQVLVEYPNPVNNAQKNYALRWKKYGEAEKR